MCPATLQGKVEFKSSQLVGKTTYIIVVPPAEGELDDAGRTPFASKNFVTKEMYDAAKKSEDERKTLKASFELELDKEIATLKAAVGKQVQLHYTEHKGVPSSCFGETNVKASRCHTMFCA